MGLWLRYLPGGCCIHFWRFSYQNRLLQNPDRILLTAPDNDSIHPYSKASFAKFIYIHTYSNQSICCDQRCAEAEVALLGKHRCARGCGVISNFLLRSLFSQFSSWSEKACVFAPISSAKFSRMLSWSVNLEKTNETISIKQEWVGKKITYVQTQVPLVSAILSIVSPAAWATVAHAQWTPSTKKSILKVAASARPKMHWFSFE